MRRYGVTATAEQDLEDILTYIASDNPKAALRLIDRLEIQFGRLAETPGLGRSRPDLAHELRSFPLGNYLIFYHPEPGGIIIVRVLHAARNIPDIAASGGFLDDLE